MIQKAQRTAEVHKCSAVSEVVDIPVPQFVEEKIAEVVKVIPRELVSERTVEKIVHVPVEISHIKSGPDAGDNPFARVTGLITDLILDDSESTLTS